MKRPVSFHHWLIATAKVKPINWISKTQNIKQFFSSQNADIFINSCIKQESSIYRWFFLRCVRFIHFLHLLTCKKAIALIMAWQKINVKMKKEINTAKEDSRTNKDAASRKRGEERYFIWRYYLLSKFNVTCVVIWVCVDCRKSSAAI